MHLQIEIVQFLNITNRYHFKEFIATEDRVVLLNAHPILPESQWAMKQKDRN